MKYRTKTCHSEEVEIMKYREELKAWMNKNGYTNKTFGEKIGVSGQYVYQIVSGRRNASYLFSDKVYKATNGEVEYKEQAERMTNEAKTITLDQTTIKMLHYLSLMEPDGVRSLIEAMYNKVADCKVEEPELSPACRLLWMHMNAE